MSRHRSGDRLFTFTRLPSRNGAASALQMQLNGYTRSSSAGSRRRPCYHPPEQPCCSGRCLLAARSTCARSMAGKPSPHRPSISQLTSQLDPIPCIFPETAPGEIPTTSRPAPTRRPIGTNLATCFRLFLKLPSAGSQAKKRGVCREATDGRGPVWRQPQNY
jgi:hypothetical protein